jgi:hypothetical protein
MASFKGLKPPFPKHMEIFNYLLRPDPNQVKFLNLCCGLGFGKTLIGIQLAALTLNYDGNQRVLFYEPDDDRIKSIFLYEWKKRIPESYYEIHKGEQCVLWYNGSELLYRARVVTGSLEHRQDKPRGIPSTAVIDDESAIGFDQQQQTNTLARVRLPSDLRYFVTLTTPKLGPYAQSLKLPNRKLVRGKTSDNIYLPPDYEPSLRATMSKQQAKRELDGEFVALEGRIWKECDRDTAWPKGNRNDIWTDFREGEPWWLFCDLGSANAAYTIVQKMDPIYRGKRLREDQGYYGPVWVAVADFCPNDDGSASRAFQYLKAQYGIPAAIVAGQDQAARDKYEAKTLSHPTRNVFGNVRIMPAPEDKASKVIMFDCLSALICNGAGARRFTVAKNFRSHDEDSRRGVLEMLDEDEWRPIEKREPDEFLPKNRECYVQHVRDSLLMGTYKIMRPPEWNKLRDLAK